MLCQACHRLTRNLLLCDGCRRQLRPAPDRILTGGVPVFAAFAHVGPAKDLVHHLKYRGMTGYADLVAATLAPRIPHMPLVPVPRALTRRAKYGVDPAGIVARSLASHVGLPVLEGLWPAIHTRRRAGGDHTTAVVPFSTRRRPVRPVLLVDDVLTTGRTLDRAVEAIGEHLVGAAIVANAVPEVSSLRRPNRSSSRLEPNPNALSPDS